MAKKVRLKEHGGMIRIPGVGDIHDGNITFDLYQQLVSSNSNYESQFVVSEEEDKPVKEKKSKTTTDNG